ARWRYLGRMRIVGSFVSRIDTRYEPANRMLLVVGDQPMYHVSIHDTLHAVLRPADLVVLLGLLRPALAPDWSVRSLASELELPQAAVQRSLARLGETPVYDAKRRRVNRTAADELLTRAVPYIAPSKLGAPTRGVPTAWAALPLSEHISGSELPPVWPAAR